LFARDLTSVATVAEICIDQQRETFHVLSRFGLVDLA